MINTIFLILGIGLLTIGGEALIRGSLAVALRLKVSPLLSGLVIVGFGTSAPELVVSLDAAINQRPDIAIGNVVGSNIGNVLLILGICALITPLAVKPRVLRRDAVSVVIASLLFLVLASDQILVTMDAVIFLSCMTVYLIWAYSSERFHGAPALALHEAEAKEVTALPTSTLWMTLTVVLGLSLLIAGSKILMIGAIGLAQHFQISEAVIGLTLVAVGTSLPELSISVIAAIRRHADVAIGNVLGSNIFNLLGILGISALLQPLPVHARVFQFDQWVMLGSALLLMLFLYTGHRISRLEGAVLLGGYCLYIGLSFTVYGT